MSAYFAKQMNDYYYHKTKLIDHNFHKNGSFFLQSYYYMLTIGKTRIALLRWNRTFVEIFHVFCTSSFAINSDVLVQRCELS